MNRDDIFDNIDFLGIEELKLSKYIYNALKRAGIKNIGEVKRLIERDEFTRIQYVGENAKNEVKQKLRRYINNFDPEVEQLSMDVSAEKQPASYLVDDNEHNSIFLLEDLIGKEKMNTLMDVGIKTISQLNDMIIPYLLAIESGENIISEKNEDFKKQIFALRENGLSMQVVVDGRKLYKILKSEASSPLQSLLMYRDLHSVIFPFRSLQDEISFLYSNLSEREKVIFIASEVNNISYRELGAKWNISKQRISQIKINAVEKLIDALSIAPFVFIQSALILADELGQDLHRNSWKRKLVLGEFFRGCSDQEIEQIFNRLLALASNGKNVCSPFHHAIKEI